MLVVKYTRGEDVKYTFDTFKGQLLALGWKVADGNAETKGEDDEKEESTEAEVLRAEAEALGLKPHHKAGVEKLRQMIKEAKGE